MALTLLQQRKTQKYLIMVFIGVLLVTVFVLWTGFFKKEELPPSEVLPMSVKRVEINYELLIDQRIKGLQLFENIPLFEEEPGRENPFVPY